MSFAWLDALLALLPDPRLTWGLLSRGVGVLLFTALATLLPQVVALAGKSGGSPIATRLARMREDFPGPGRFFRLPTLLWINASDRALYALPVLGMLASCVVIYGGPWAKPALFVAWLCLLSLDTVAALYFPWDCMVLEAGFLALLLPQTEALPSLNVVAEPLPLVSFAFRLLVIRLMWGFAKVKFVGTKPNDKLYLKGFLTWAPLPTPLGWWAQHAPHWILRASLWFMFFAEVIAPLLAWFSGPVRLVGLLGVVGLMVGIQLTGNWGYFNLGYIILCLCLLDVNASVLDVAKDGFAAFLTPGPAMIINAVACVLIFMQVVQFVFNSWCTSSWMHWNFDNLTYKQPWLRALIGFFRLTQPLRMVHAYGVFPPNSSPPIKIVPVFEGSDDGVTWKPYRYHHMPTTAEEAPPVVAPYHPRFDQSLIYGASGLTESNSMASLIGNGRPYGWAYYSHVSFFDRGAQRLLEGNPAQLAMLASNPFKDGPPREIRVSTLALTPTSISELRSSGRYWRVRRCGVLIPPQKLDPQVWEDAVPPPELFHTDHVDDKRRAPSLRAMLAALSAGNEADVAVRVASDFSADEVDVFWRDVVPAMAAQPEDSVGRLLERAAQLRERFGEPRMRRFERLMERFSLMLRERVAPNAFGDAQPALPKLSHYRLCLLINAIVLDGRETLLAALAEPGLVAKHAQACRDLAIFRGQILFRPRMVDFLIRSQRVNLRVMRKPEIALPGVWEFLDMLTQHEPDGEVWLPVWSLTDAGDFVIEGFGGETDFDDSRPSMAAS
jgi:hypothetical protein